jgi:hypothetical protein
MWRDEFFCSSSPDEALSGAVGRLRTATPKALPQSERRVTMNKNQARAGMQP